MFNFEPLWKSGNWGPCWGGEYLGERRTEESTKRSNGGGKVQARMGAGGDRIE